MKRMTFLSTMLIFLMALFTWTGAYAVGPSATINAVPIVAGAPVSATNPQPAKLTDGTSVVTVKAASTPAAATDKALVVELRPGGNAPALPSGAATAAKQPALGTAGTASADVISVQGVSGGTPVPVAGAGTAGSPGTAVMTVQGISGGTPAPVAVTATLDPCMNPNVAKSSVVLSTSSSTTASLVATSGTTVIYVCGVSATLGGTTPTATFVTGTQTTTPCDTGASNLTGAYAPSATIGSIAMGWGGTVMKTAAGGQLCLTTGATSDIAGALTYVQQ